MLLFLTWKALLRRILSGELPRYTEQLRLASERSRRRIQDAVLGEGRVEVEEIADLLRLIRQARETLEQKLDLLSLGRNAPAFWRAAPRALVVQIVEAFAEEHFAKEQSIFWLLQAFSSEVSDRREASLYLSAARSDIGLATPVLGRLCFDSDRETRVRAYHSFRKISRKVAARTETATVTLDRDTDAVDDELAFDEEETFLQFPIPGYRLIQSLKVKVARKGAEYVATLPETELFGVGKERFEATFDLCESMSELLSELEGSEAQTSRLLQKELATVSEYIEVEVP